MIRCHLNRLMGERRLKVADVVRDTGLPRALSQRSGEITPPGLSCQC